MFTYGRMIFSRPMEPTPLETPRLVLRRFAPADAAFVVRLVNDPDWVRNIGDRGVRTEEDAAGYLARGPIALYERLGFGLYLVALRETGEPIGMCGLVKRAGLDDVDLGFAFLPAWRGKGYAAEASRAVLAEAHERFGIARVLAIVSPANLPSCRVLETLGFRCEGAVRLDPAADEVLRYTLENRGQTTIITR